MTQPLDDLSPALFHAFSVFSRQIPRQKAPWLLSVSGGKDSLLMWYLAELWIKHKCPDQKLIILHVQYPFRKAAAIEAQSLAQLAKDNKRSFVLRSVTWKSGGPTSNWEALARAERLALYHEQMAQHPTGVVLVGSHAQDKMENVWLRCSRQSTWWTWMTTQDLPFSLCSPLAALTRTDILAASVHVPWPAYEDFTNTDLRFDRNRVRQDLLPYAKQRLGSSNVGYSAVFQMQKHLDSHLIRQAKDALEHYIGSHWRTQTTLSHRVLQALPEGIWQLCIWVWLSQRSGMRGINTQRFVQLLQVLGGTRYPKTVHFPDIGTVAVHKDELHLSQEFRKDIVDGI